MMATRNILCCVKIILLHIALIMGADQMTDRSDQNSNVQSQELEDSEKTLLLDSERIKVPFHSELSHLFKNVLIEHNSGSFRSMDNYTKIFRMDHYHFPSLPPLASSTTTTSNATTSFRIPFKSEIAQEDVEMIDAPLNLWFLLLKKYTVILEPTEDMIRKLQVEYQEREIPLWIYKSIFKRFSGLIQNETRTSSLRLDLPTKKGIPKVINKDSFLKQKIKSWMSELIGSEDIMMASYINEDLVYKTLSKLGSRFENWKSAFYHKLREEHEIVDVGLIRYPDFDSPFIVFFQLRFVVYRTSKKILSVYQEDKNGVLGSITVSRYIPDEKTKKKLNSKKFLDKETKRAEDILN